MDIAEVYEEQINWRKNTFSPPSGHSGTDFVRETTRLLRAYADKTPLERVALRAVTVMPGLMLQKPHPKAGTKEFVKHLSRRLNLWKEGRIQELLAEARAIQSRLAEDDSRSGMTTEKLNSWLSRRCSPSTCHPRVSSCESPGRTVGQ